MQEVFIDSFESLQQEVFLDVWDDSLKRYRDNRVYRGVQDKSWGLKPSLNRVCAHDLSLEKQMIRSFRKYGYTDLQNVHSFWQMIAMAQQFGLPTRLLDWTYSPLVAAHFATEDVLAYDTDGAIWCADVNQMNAQLPEKLQKLLQEERCSIFTMEMLDRLGDNFEKLQEIREEPYAFFFEPASAVDRIANQYALFSLTTDTNKTIDQLPEFDKYFKKIVIPSKVKLEIRDKLDYINISERMIYPGLDGICKWITRRYADLGPQYNKERNEREIL